MIGWIVAGLLALCCVELLRRISKLGLLLRSEQDQMGRDDKTISRLNSRLAKAQRHFRNIAESTQSAIEDLEK